jgi:dsDNA-specific endonuclease/ATPase MutS2
MGENKYLNYILLAIVIFLVILQIWNPFKKKEGMSEFEKTFEKAEATLDRFEKLNNELQGKADSLKIARFQIDAAYNQQMPQYAAALSEISRKIDLANRQYLNLLRDLNAEKQRFLESGAPDSIPYLHQLRDRKYLNNTPN